jgi:pimeloyl-ACP methyl ester carboxylesterase
VTLTDIDTLPVHHIDHGGNPDGPQLVLVHGLGGSHLNWSLLVPLLTPHARVLALDLPGFGLSEPHGRSASVSANADLLGRWLDAVTAEPVVLVGNSMGGLISALLAGRRPDLVRAVALIDPALPPAGRSLPDPVVVGNFLLYVTPLLGPRLVAWRRSRRTGRQLTMDTLRLCTAHPERIPESFVAEAAALIDHRRGLAGGDAAFLEATRSILRTNADRSMGWRTYAAITAPVLLIHGEKDRLVPHRAALQAHRRNPTWTFVDLPDVGHIPQIEVPQLTAEHLTAWLATL